MLDWLPTPDGPRALALLVLLAMAAIAVARVALATGDTHATIAAILARDGKLPAHLLVTYRWRMPFTWGAPRTIRIRVPVRDIPHIRDETQANEIGRQIRDTYGMRSAETRLAHGIRYWTLTR